VNETQGTLAAWVEQLADALGIAAEEVDVTAILDLAREAAHSVERPAAPITTFAAGYAAGLRGGGKAEVAATLSTAAALAKRGE
jgi:hypothetical protein